VQVEHYSRRHLIHVWDLVPRSRKTVWVEALSNVLMTFCAAMPNVVVNPFVVIHYRRRDDNHIWMKEGFEFFMRVFESELRG
jgi:hypothetical protein